MSNTIKILFGFKKCMRVGVAELPLHTGKVPRWLFFRMKKLAGQIAKIIVLEYGTKELLERLSDPFWFQAFSCVLGFDWHSSGTTTVTIGALREALKPELEVMVAGGKKKGKKILDEIRSACDKLGLEHERFVRASRLSAKVDVAGLQDGFALYHHAIIMDSKGNWAVIQQGMRNKYARRYHLFNVKKFEEEPNRGVMCDVRGKVLNMVAREAKEARRICVDLANERPSRVMAYITGQKTLLDWNRKVNVKYLKMPISHTFEKRLYQNLLKAYERAPKNFEELLSIKGVGPKTIRALALVSQLVFGTELCWKDPVKFSFAHGGKDGVPYPVSRRVYDSTIRLLQEAIEQAEIGKKERIDALRRLSTFLEA